MACPTCDHTVQMIAQGVFWCPRCGSISSFNGLTTKSDSPKLVERCRVFSEYLFKACDSSTWRRFSSIEEIVTKD